MSDARLNFNHDEDRRFGTLELARPDVHNAIDWQFVEELDAITEQILRLDQTRQIDCLLIKAQGRNFCVGGDISEFPTDPEAAVSHIQAMANIAHRSTMRLHQLSVPVVTRVQGAVAGAGVGLVLGADITVGAENASFTLAFSGVGVTPDGGTSWNLPRAVGYRTAMDLLLSNRRVGAAEAVSLGLLSRAVGVDDLDVEITRTVDAILALGSDVGRESKRLVSAAVGNTLSAHLADEASTIARLAAAPLAQERLAKLRD